MDKEDFRAASWLQDIMVSKLAQAIQAASSLREASFSHDDGAYAVSILDAAEQAAKDHGLAEPFGKIIWLLLEGLWEDALVWAKENANG